MKRFLHVDTVPVTLRFLGGQVEYMRQSGFEVHVATAAGPELEAFGEATGAIPHVLPLTRTISPRTDIEALAAARELMRCVRPDIVHGHTPKGALISMLAAASLRVPRRIYHLRGMPLLTATPRMFPALWAAESLTMASAHKVVAVSHSLADAVRSLRLPAGDKMVVLGAGSSNGVDTERFQRDASARTAARRDFGLPDKTVVFGFVGRLVADKGIRDLVDAWELATNSRGFPDARLLIIGSYEVRDPVGADVRRRIEASPTILHRPFMADVIPAYSTMDVLVLPTHREGFPNVALEAAAMALPVITTDAVGAVDSVVHGETGTIVPVRSAPELARAIEEYARRPALRAQHGLAGRERALRDFRAESIWASIRALYEHRLDR